MRVVIADDHEMIREALVKLIDSQPGIEVVGDAHDGYSAVECVMLTEPDILIIDIMMPGLNGVEAAKLISQQVPQTKIIALSNITDGPLLQRMIEAGAVGYLTKEEDIEDIIAVLNKVSQGEKVLPGSLR